MTRAASDCGWTFGDGDLLSSPDCGSRHPLGRVASSRGIRMSVRRCCARFRFYGSRRADRG